MNLKKKKIIRFLLIGGSIASIGLILTSCLLFNFKVPKIKNNLISETDINENTSFINNLSLSINYVKDNKSSFGTGYIIDNDISNDNLLDNDLFNLRHYYIITNTHVLENGYEIVKSGTSTPVSQAIRTTFHGLRLGYTNINNPDKIQYTALMPNFNNKFQVMGLGINMQEGTWRDVEILRLSLTKNEIKNIPQFDFYEKNKNKIKFNQNPLITNRFLPENQQPEVTAGGYPYNNSLSKPIWTQFKQKNDFQWYIGQMKQYVKNGVEFRYNAVDYSVVSMDMSPGSSGSLAVLNDNSILGNYWGTLSNNTNVFGIVTPYIAKAKMYKFSSNIYNPIDRPVNNKRDIIFANFSDSPLIIPSRSNFTVDMRGSMSSTQFEKEVNSYDKLISIIRNYVPNYFFYITPSYNDKQEPDPIIRPMSKDIVIDDIQKTKNDIPGFKLENISINQNIIQDWKNLVKQYNYKTYLSQKN